MFDLVEVGNYLIEGLAASIILNDIHKEYDLSSDTRSRRVKIDSSLDLKKTTFEININYRSQPKLSLG